MSLKLKFALFTATSSSNWDDNGVRRMWLSRLDGSNSTFVKNAERALQMSIDEAVEAYKVLDNPLLKLGLVPLEP